VGIKIIGLGATHPFPGGMMSITNAVYFLKATFGIETTDKTAETFGEIGMHYRWLSGYTSDQLLLAAAIEAIERAQRLDHDFEAEKLSAVICGGSTLPRAYPSQAARISSQIGALPYQNIALDISGACSSWTQSILAAANAMKAQSLKYALIGCGEVIASRANDPGSGNFLMWDDNGAASVLRFDDYSDSTKPYDGIVRTFSGCHYHNFAESVGLGSDYIIPVMNPQTKNSSFTVGRPDAHLNNGKELYRYITDPKTVSALTTRVLKESSIAISDRTFLVPHGANLRMVNKLGEIVGFEPQNVLTMLGRNGRSNMSSASIPSTLEYYAAKPNFFRPDDVIVMVSYSAGLLVDIIVYRVASDD